MRPAPASATLQDAFGIGAPLWGAPPPWRFGFSQRAGCIACPGTAHTPLRAGGMECRARAFLPAFRRILISQSANVGQVRDLPLTVSSEGGPNLATSRKDIVRCPSGTRGGGSQGRGDQRDRVKKRPRIPRISMRNRPDVLLRSGSKAESPRRPEERCKAIKGLLADGATYAEIISRMAERGVNLNTESLSSGQRGSFLAHWDWQGHQRARFGSCWQNRLSALPRLALPSRRSGAELSDAADT